MGRGCIFRIPARGRTAICLPFSALLSGCAQGRGRLPKPQTDEKVKACGRMASAQHAASPPAPSLTAAMGGTLPSSASKIAGQSRFVPPDKLACVPRSRQFSAACPLHAGILLRRTAPASGRGLLARCMRAFCFAKPQNPLFSKNRRGRICRTSIRRKCRFARLWLKRPGTVSACC